MNGNNLVKQFNVILSEYHYNLMKINDELLTQFENQVRQATDGDDVFEAKSTVGNLVKGKKYKIYFEHTKVTVGNSNSPWVAAYLNELGQTSRGHLVTSGLDVLRSLV